MIYFWLVVVIMSLAAIGILIYPFLWHGGDHKFQSKELSILLYREKLQQIEDEKTKGEMSEEAYQRQLIILQKSLLMEMQACPSSGDENASSNPREGAHKLLLNKPSKIFPVVLSCAFIAFALVLYIYLGNGKDLHHYIIDQKNAEATAAEIKKLGSVDDIIEKLKHQVAQRPDARGWYLLGRLYMKNEQLQLAIDAFHQANLLQPHQADILLSYAEAIYLHNSNQLNPAARKLLQEVLLIQQDQMDALNLLAIDAFQNASYAKAIQYWEKALTAFPPESDNAGNIMRMIALAHEKMNQQHPNKLIQLKVYVTLKDDLKKTLTGKETLFVFAQAVDGPQIPLAVVKRSVRELPLSISLDESMAMLPAMTLANATEIRIVARISKTGQAIAPSGNGTGDMIGESTVVDVHHPPKLIEVVINHEINQDSTP